MTYTTVNIIARAACSVYQSLRNNNRLILYRGLNFFLQVYLSGETMTLIFPARPAGPVE